MSIISFEDYIRTTPMPPGYKYTLFDSPYHNLDWGDIYGTSGFAIYDQTDPIIVDPPTPKTPLGPYSDTPPENWHPYGRGAVDGNKAIFNLYGQQAYIRSNPTTGKFDFNGAYFTNIFPYYYDEYGWGGDNEILIYGGNYVNGEITNMVTEDITIHFDDDPKLITFNNFKNIDYLYFYPLNGFFAMDSVDIEFSGPSASISPSSSVSSSVSPGVSPNSGALSSVIPAISPYDVGNDRHPPFMNDAFTRHSLFTQYSGSGNIDTDRFVKGGSLAHLQDQPSKRVKYPADIVWKLKEWTHLDLTKPAHQSDVFGRHGTYGLGVWEPLSTSSNIKFITSVKSEERSYYSGFDSQADIVDKWIITRLLITPNPPDYSTCNVFLGGDLGDPGYILYHISASGEERNGVIEAVQFMFNDEQVYIFIDGIDITTYTPTGQQIVLEQSVFNKENGMNGWKEINTDGAFVFDDSKSTSLTKMASDEGLYYNAGLQKILSNPIPINQTIEISIRVKYTDLDFVSFGEDAWRNSAQLFINALTLSYGTGIQGIYYPANGSEKTDLYINTLNSVGYGPTLTHPLTDYKLCVLADNQQWKFDRNKYSSYINKESPAYVCEIDASTLFNDITEYQKLYSAIPDMKRWLYAYFSGFVKTLSKQDSATTEKISTMDLTSKFLPNEDTQSDMVIEVWDAESNIGNNQKGNWRPFSPSAFDNFKVPGSVIFEGLHISDNPDYTFDDLTNLYGDMYSFCISYYNEEDMSFHFPKSNGFPNETINKKSNLMLQNRKTGLSLHVAYIESIGDECTVPGPTGIEQSWRHLYKVYAHYDPDKIGDISGLIVDPKNIPSNMDDYLFDLKYAKKNITENPSSKIFTENVVHKNITSLITDNEVTKKYIDLKSSDIDRYIINDKIFFRIRPLVKKNYMASYVDKDTSEIQYEGLGATTSGVNGAGDWSNFPWATFDPTIEFDEAFDWSKIKTTEDIYRFGMTYFGAASD